MTTKWKTLAAVAVTHPRLLQHLLHRNPVSLCPAKMMGWIPRRCPNHESGHRSPLRPSTRTTPSSTLPRRRYLRLRPQALRRRPPPRLRLPRRSTRPLHLPPSPGLISSSPEKPRRQDRRVSSKRRRPARGRDGRAEARVATVQARSLSHPLDGQTGLTAWGK